MDYRKKLKEYSFRIKNQSTLKFVNFLETLFDWIDVLESKKRLSPEQKKKALKLAPQKIFESLDHVSAEELSQADYGKLKDILDVEAIALINFVIEIGKLRMTDFDLLQFNLYQIFGKEELASMVEHTRERISEKIFGERSKEAVDQEKKKLDEAEWQRKLMTMPQKDMNKVILGSMFDFAPSARTQEERLDAIKNNQKRVNSQKLIFRNFETKLVEATETAKSNAQNKVYRKIGEVKRGMAEITNKFREKAREFVSDEGPKKMIINSREMITNQKKWLHNELKDRGKDWEKHFSQETKKAQFRISNKGTELDIQIFKKGKYWKKNFLAKTHKAQKNLFEQRKRLSDEEKVRKEFIAERGGSELQGARKRIGEGTAEFEKDVGQAKFKFAEKAEEILDSGQKEITEAKEKLTSGKEDFEVDVLLARKKFSGKEELIGDARDYFIKQRDVARYRFMERGGEVETEMYGTIYRERSRFEKERGIAREKFLRRGAEILDKAKAHISGKKKKFAEQRGEAGSKFLSKAKEIKKPVMKGVAPATSESGGKKVPLKATEAKGKIEKEHLAMMERSRLSREKMMGNVIHKRDLFLYDTRFAKHSIQENAKQFAEKVAAKKEEFGARGKQIVSRHKARQKAHLIRNLLRTIRSVQVR